MPGAPINLNRARKAREKVKKSRQATENAAKFGRTKSDRAREAAQDTGARARLDAHRREDGEPDA